MTTTYSPRLGDIGEPLHTREYEPLPESVPVPEPAPAPVEPAEPVVPAEPVPA